MNHRALLGILSGVALAGCTTPPRPVAFFPVPAAAAPPVTPPPAAPEGVYRMPKIGKVYLRAHVDANGRLLGPQVVYQIVEPGGWNVEALEPANPEPVKAATPVFEADAGWLIKDSNPPH